jgi:hypothetical protein
MLKTAGNFETLTDERWTMRAIAPTQLVSVAATAAAVVALGCHAPVPAPVLVASPVPPALRGLVLPPRADLSPPAPPREDRPQVVPPRPAPLFALPHDLPVPVAPELPFPGFDLAQETGLTVGIFGLSGARQREVPELAGLVVAAQIYLLEAGRSLYFETDAPGHPAIWRLDLNTRLIDRMATVNGAEEAAGPALTLDARWLVFARGRRRRLARVDLHDPRRPLTEVPGVEGISRLSVDASGQLVAYTVDHGGQSDIELYDFAHARVLAPPFVNSPANETFSWLFPDGHTLAFTSDRGGNPDLYLVDLARGPVEALTGANSPAPELAPAYIGGTTLEFASTRTGLLRIYTYDWTKGLVNTLPY